VTVWFVHQGKWETTWRPRDLKTHKSSKFSGLAGAAPHSSKAGAAKAPQGRCGQELLIFQPAHRFVIALGSQTNYPFRIQVEQSQNLNNYDFSRFLASSPHADCAFRLSLLMEAAALSSRPHRAVVGLHSKVGDAWFIGFGAAAWLRMMVASSHSSVLEAASSRAVSAHCSGGGG